MDNNTIKSIIKNHDAKRLCELDETAFNDFMIVFTDEYLHKMKSEKLNGVQKTILDCWTLENAYRMGGALSLVEDAKIFFALPESVASLETIGAKKTAEALKNFIALIPEGTFDNKVLPKKSIFDNESTKKEIERINAVISEYPDGKISSLYREFICSDEKTAEALLLGMAEDSDQRTGAESLRIAIGSLVAFLLIGVVYCVCRFGFGFEFLAILNFPRTWISAVAVGAMCPLFLSLFFFGRYCKECGKSKIAYELLNSISAILLAASLLHMLLSLMGVLG